MRLWEAPWPMALPCPAPSSSLQASAPKATAHVVVLKPSLGNVRLQAARLPRLLQAWHPRSKQQHQG